MELQRTSDGTVFCWSEQFWILLLQFALRYDWRPSGSSFFEERTVSATEAAQLGSALQEGLSDIPNVGAVASKVASLAEAPADYAERNPNKVIVTQDDMANMNAFEKMALAKSHLIEFISFCRDGGFEINTQTNSF